MKTYSHKEVARALFATSRHVLGVPPFCEAAAPLVTWHTIGYALAYLHASNLISAHYTAILIVA